VGLSSGMSEIYHQNEQKVTKLTDIPIPEVPINQEIITVSALFRTFINFPQR